MRRPPAITSTLHQQLIISLTGLDHGPIFGIRFVQDFWWYDVWIGSRDDFVGFFVAVPGMMEAWHMEVAAKPIWR